MPSKPLIYLATPYSHPDPAVRLQRVRNVNRLAANMIKAGQIVFSPISQSHYIAVDGHLSEAWEAWRDYDLEILSRCDELHVYMQPGWDVSIGVAAEMEFAKNRGMPMVFKWFQEEA